MELGGEPGKAVTSVSLSTFLSSGFFLSQTKELYQPQACSALLSFAVIKKGTKPFDQSKLGEQMVYFGMQVTAHLWGKSGQKLNRNYGGMTACWLTHKRILPSTAQDHLPKEWCCQQWAGPSHINEQLRQFPKDIR